MYLSTTTVDHDSRLCHARIGGRFAGLRGEWHGSSNDSSLTTGAHRIGAWNEAGATYKKGFTLNLTWFRLRFLLRVQTQRLCPLFRSRPQLQAAAQCKPCRFIWTTRWHTRVRDRLLNVVAPPLWPALHCREGLGWLGEKFAHQRNISSCPKSGDSGHAARLGPACTGSRRLVHRKHPIVLYFCFSSVTGSCRILPRVVEV